MSARVHAMIGLYETPDGHFYARVAPTDDDGFQSTPFKTRDACLHDVARELSARSPRVHTPPNEAP